MSVQNIQVTVSLDANNTPVFNYVPAGPVVVTESGTQIIYSLQDKTGKGLSFAGAAFATPFDRVIDAVELLNETTLALYDADTIVGKTGFRLVFNIAGSTLQLCSPDPQVINKDVK
ncbi:DP-EP family protein [Shewanella litorisediminis]|uniref:DP-EP family protein n=1 Tax=Shewanella litorisediminis TaxID=1173586 RepID=A0ABX7G4I7_9GAMM|nr:DP-EP family protein [Shewanella litorisediminis]MCL2917792.1 DP-EP family protein [Shewanella litorisediminis]QRH02235.1 DP-EP family protein [Shewanella litorisediminis]